jgi:hypothetical protein
MIFRPAAPADGQEMLKLIEAHPAGGGMKILYTRRPDAYQSYRMECPDAEMYVYTDNNGCLLAQIACLPRKVYVNGKIITVGYVTGLHKAGGVFVNIIKMLEAGRVRSSAKHFFCSILDGNESVFNLFAKRGLFYAMYDYTTYLLHPAAVKRKRHNLIFRRAQKDDTARLLDFYNTEGKRYSYFPVFSAMNDFSGLNISDFYLLEDRSELVAAGALWDQRAFKQYVAIDYKGIYRLAAHCNPLLRVLHYPPLPSINTAANFAQLSFLVCKDSDRFLEQIMLGELAAVGKMFNFLAIGCAAQDPLSRSLNGLRSLKFGSKICMYDHAGVGFSPAETIPRFECALL